MKLLSITVVLAALLRVSEGNSTAKVADDGGNDPKYRVGNSLGSFHGLGGVSSDLVKYVLSGIQNGATDVLMVSPTQLGRVEQFGFNGLNNDAVEPGYQFRPPVPPFPVPFPPVIRGGGGYRGVRPLPVSPVGGGYRGVSPAAVVPLRPIPPIPPLPPLRAQAASKKPSAVERPFRPVLPQDVLANDKHPNRGSRFDRDSSWRPEIVVDKASVIREDKQSERPRPDALFKPDSGIRPIGEQKPPPEKPRPAVVPVTDDGPPSKDFISNLEAELVAGLTPQQLEELSFQAIDPRAVESKSSKKLNGKIVFPGRVV